MKRILAIGKAVVVDPRKMRDVDKAF